MNLTPSHSAALRANGFTLIEIIVSLGIFSFVITMAVGALLILLATSEQLRGEQSVMTNLSFAVDSMTREIRAGTDYYCDSRPNYSAGGPNNIFDNNNDLDTILTSGGDPETQDCSAGNSGGRRLQGVAFREGGDSITGPSDERILYFFDEEAGQILRRVGGGAAQSIVSGGIFIEEAEFIVTGTNSLADGGGGAIVQPTVTLFIEARETDSATDKSFYLQTTITQRQLDV